MAEPRSAGRSSLAADFLIEAGDWPDAAKLRGLVDRALAAAMTVAAPTLVADAEVSLVFTDDRHVRELNRRYRDKDAATNVLSFPAGRTSPDVLGPPLGDIVLAQETIEGEAAAQGLAIEDHLTHLIVHGFLHLLRYDHDDEEEATLMEGLETAILNRLGIADPYADKDG